MSLKTAARATSQDRLAGLLRWRARGAMSRALLAGLVAVVVAASSGVGLPIAMASQLRTGQLAHGGPPPGARTQHNGHQSTLTGAITSLGSGSFVLTTAWGATWTINVSPSTTYAEHGVSSPSLANVSVGDGAVVSGTQVTTSMVDASSVAISPPAASGAASGKGGPGHPAGHGRPGH